MIADHDPTGDVRRQRGSGETAVRHSSIRRGAAVMLSGVLAGTALSAVPTGAALGVETGAAPPATTQVFITKYRNITMPERLRPGVNRIVIRSTRSSAFQVLRARPGYTKRELARDANLIFQDKAALKRLERNTTFYGGVSSRRGAPGVLFTRLPRGRYLALDTNPNKILARKIVSFQVRGERMRGVLPGRATIRAVGAVDWAKRPRSIPGSGRLVFRNNSSEDHFVLLNKLKKGKTGADFAQWVDDATSGGNSAPPLRFDVGVDTGVVSPGKAMSMRLDGLPRGRYILLCFWPDADMDLMPHVFMGMWRVINVR